MDLLIKDKYVEKCVHDCVDGLVKRQTVGEGGVVSWHDVPCEHTMGWMIERYVDSADLDDRLDDVMDKLNDILEAING